MSAQRVFAPAAGFVRAVETAPYQSFPDTPLKRIGWALNAPLVSATGKVVLVILAYHADSSGKAWPSVETIASEASIGRRTAFRACGFLRT